MTFVELLEKDRNSLIGEIENTPRPAETQEILEKEVDRLLYRYNETEKEDIKRITASDQIQVVRMSLPLIDSVGDNIVWTTGKQEKKNGYALPLGLLLGGAAILLFVLLSGRILSSAFSLIYKLVTLVGFGSRSSASASSSAAAIFWERRGAVRHRRTPRGRRWKIMWMRRRSIGHCTL